MWTVTIPQWGSIFGGEPALEGSTKPHRTKPDDMDRWLTLLNILAIAPVIPEATESVVGFFQVERDLTLLVPKDERAEFSFSFRNGFVPLNCSVQLIYPVRVVYEKYHTCNLIGLVLPKEVKYYVSKDGYFETGYIAHDATCNLVNSHHQPITDERLIVKCGDWYGAYILCTDMITALPTEIGKLLSSENLRDIKFTPGVGLTPDGRTPVTFGGFQGVTNSFYGLRGVA